MPAANDVPSKSLWLTMRWYGWVSPDARSSRASLSARTTVASKEVGGHGVSLLVGVIELEVSDQTIADSGEDI